MQSVQLCVWVIFIYVALASGVLASFFEKETKQYSIKNHPLCGCALNVIQKYVIPVYNSKCSSHYSKERNDVLMANQTNELSHSKWMCKYHIVFTPKYRRKIIYNQYREDLIEIFKRLCSYKGVEIIEGHMMSDHVHILVSIPPKIAVSTFVGYLKGKSALVNKF